MVQSSNFGYPPVTKSITNPSVSRKDAIDLDSPMAFLTFIKTINTNFEPETLQKYYNNYLQLWNETSNKISVDNRSIITAKYQEFLREISLNYTTLEEKKFLKKIDFTDPYDLDVAISFYSRKLKEIALSYNNKRENLKFETTRKKLKGSNQGIEKNLRDLIISDLSRLEDIKIISDIEDIKQKIEVEIEEFFDTYPLYYNQDPSNLYDNKDLDYGLDIFLKDDRELIDEVFGGVSEEIRELKEVESLFDNKRRLTEKYIASDFYYLSTGSTVTDFISGQIFEASFPSLNIPNRNFPTTASTDRKQYQSYRERGFFRPSNTSIITLDGKNSSFFINFENLKPNTTYYFPDPNLYGENGDILTFIVDDSYLKKNFSTGNAVNQPNSSPHDTKYFGYHSQIDQNFQKYLDSLFDLGYIQDAKQDLFGNTFALLKRDQFQTTIEQEDDKIIKSLYLNGHTFYDTLYNEGYFFDYSTIDDTTYTQTVRSGLSTIGNGFTENNPYYTLFFRYFSPYDELIPLSESNFVTTYEILDGAFFLKSNKQPMDDSMSSDLDAFPANGIYYFNFVTEGGLHSPSQRALLDPLFPALTADMTASLAVDNITAFNVDGGYFTEPFDFDYSFGSDGFDYVDVSHCNSVYSLTATSTDNIFNRYDLPGTIYVKNAQTGHVLPILDAIPYLNTKYPIDVLTDLLSVTRFEIAQNTIFIESPNFLIIDTLNVKNGSFDNPKTVSHFINHGGNFDKVSNRFKIGDHVYYTVLQTLTSTLSSNNFVIYPQINRYDVRTNKHERLFPTNIGINNLDTSFFNISGDNVRYISADAPVLTYNSRNNIFNISYLLKDQNNLFHLHDIDVDIEKNMKFLSHKRYTPTDDQYSNIFTPDYYSTLSVYMSTGFINVSAEELIV